MTVTQLTLQPSPSKTVQGISEKIFLHNLPILTCVSGGLFVEGNRLL
jgi:hypothetical protein